MDGLYGGEVFRCQSLDDDRAQCSTKQAYDARIQVIVRDCHGGGV